MFYGAKYCCLLFIVLIAACEPQTPLVDTHIEHEIADPEHFQRCEQALLQSPKTVLPLLLTGANELKQQTKSFLSKPNANSLHQLQQAWHQLHRQMYDYRFFLDLSRHLKTILPTLQTLNHAIAANNIQPGYLDAFGPYLYSGLVFELSVPLEKETLRLAQNESDEDEGIFGLYAVEFMVFGVDAQRSYKEYLPIKSLSAQHRELGFDSATELPNNRRRKLLRLLVSALRDDIRDATTMWLNADANGVIAKWDTLNPPKKMGLLRASIGDSITRLHAAVIKPKINEDISGDYTETLFAYPNSADLLKRWTKHINDATSCLNNDIATGLHTHLQELSALSDKALSDDDLESKKEKLASISKAMLELILPPASDKTSAR